MHGLVAVSIFSLVTSANSGTPKIQFPTHSQLLVLIFVSCLPDVDFLLSFLIDGVKHRGFTHSAFFVVLFWLFARRVFEKQSNQNQKWHTILTLVLASHILVDLSVQDGHYPTTLQLFWPSTLEVSANHYFPLLPPINWVLWGWEPVPSTLLQLARVAVWESAVGALFLALTISCIKLRFLLYSR